MKPVNNKAGLTLRMEIEVAIKVKQQQQQQLHFIENRNVTNYITFPSQIAYELTEAGRSENILQVQSLSIYRWTKMQMTMEMEMEKKECVETKKEEEEIDEVGDGYDHRNWGWCKG